MKYKAAWRYYFFLILFSSVALLGAKVIFMLLNGEIMYEDEPMHKSVAILISIPLCVVLSNYVITSYTLLRQLIKFEKSVVTITPEGIENTLVFLNLFAFIFVLPVKLIPWEAVKYFDEENTYIRVNTKLVKAGWFAKLLLLVLGYQFCYSFIKPNVKSEEITPYQHLFKLNGIL